MNDQEKAVASTLQDYATALNRSDVDAVMKLYSPDCVFMPQHFSSTVGAMDVRSAYDNIFGAIRLTVTFAMQEIQIIAPDWAFARTNSAGSVLVHATGETSSEANQELFVLQKLGGSWKIARYCFSTTNPPRA